MLLNEVLLLVGIVIMICILLGRFAESLPVPSLLIFIGLGMFFGANGPIGIQFDDYSVSESICTICLIFIMFYGGFGTNISSARPVLGKSLCLSTLGVILTAGFTGAVIHFVLRLSWRESILIGSVIASTDAASVFNILRSQSLALKDNTASLLEVESGSNDPVSYMLTLVLIAVMTGEKISVPLMLFQQICFGLAGGFLIGWIGILLLRHFNFEMEQGRTIFVFAVALTAYALPSLLGGNGYLSVYLCGILMGNYYIPDKKYLVHFFDTITGISQMIIFFLLGLLVTPAQLGPVLIPAVLIMVFLTLAGRPLSVLLILAPFRSSLRQIGVTAWSGLRGVASIVFSILVVLNDVPMKYNLFNLVFCIVLMSIAIQGTLLPWVSEKLQMIDLHGNVERTFNDYQESTDVNFIKIPVKEGDRLSHCLVKDASFPSGLLIVMIIRGTESIVPNGNTEILPGDLLVAAAPEFEDRKNLSLYENVIRPNHPWLNKPLRKISIPAGCLIVLILRDGVSIIPEGKDVLREGDIIVTARF